MKKYLVLALLSLTTLFTQAQIVDPIQSSAQLKTGKTAEGEIVFNLDIEQGWHVYSVNLGSSGPIEASFHVNKMDGVEKVGGLVARGNEISKMDNLFGMKLRFFEHKAQFVQKVRFTKPNYTIDAYLEYGACNDQTCMPPQEVAFKKAGKSPAVEAATTPQESTEKEAKDEDSPSSLNPDSMQTAATDTLLPAPVDTNQVAVSTDLWQPVIQELQQQDGRSEQNGSLWFLFLMGFAGGLLALFTPCVWPIIPMTVSFFLKRTKDKAKGMRDAITYGLAIIVIFLSLGLLVTAFTDPHKLNELATSAVFNIFFFLLLVV